MDYHKRLKLLPPYLETNPLWVDFVKVIDETFQTLIDDPIKNLARLRQLFILGDATRTKIEQELMLSQDDFEQFERSVLVEQVNTLGLSLDDTSLIRDEDYQRLYRNLALFWYSKGTDKFIDFVGFCLNAAFSITQYWSNSDEMLDNLRAEGHVDIVPLTEGGDWYPTTLVNVSYDALRFSEVRLDDIIRLFYEFSNYDLVLHSIAQESSRVIGDNPNHIVQLGGYVVVKQTIKSWEDDFLDLNMNLGGVVKHVAHIGTA